MKSVEKGGALAEVAHIGRNGDAKQQEEEGQERAGKGSVVRDQGGPVIGAGVTLGDEAMARYVEIKSGGCLAGPEDRM